MVKIEKIANSFICYIVNPDIHIKEYYTYCLNLLKEKLSSPQLYLNVIFGNITHDFKNNFPTIKCDLQIEHTLVKDGGRSVTDRIFGKTKTEDNNYYLVRIDNLDYIRNLDIIIDYSLPNITNIVESQKFIDIESKIINLSPCLTDINFDYGDRDKIITTFTNNFSNRRTLIQNELFKQKNNYENINNKYSQKDLNETYSKCKILINIHQTEHHHTFEELRVLPALMRGVIIVSEESPLKEKIPYSDYIIWSKYEEIINKVNYIEKKYDVYYNKIFNKELKTLLLNMEEKNKTNLNILDKWGRY